MFDGAPAEQFHHFIAPTTTRTNHLSSFPPLPPNTFLPFDPYNTTTPSSLYHLPIQPNDNLFHPLTTPHNNKHGQQQQDKKEAMSNAAVIPSSINFDTERDQRQLPDELIDSWSNDEVIALLRIRSGIDTWFPELTWDHVSRKLGELGYKKSAEKCKEKFEDESRYFNNIKNYRFLSELEDHHLIYQGDHHQPIVSTEGSGDMTTVMGHPLEEDQSRDNKMAAAEEEERSRDKRKRKRKRGGGGGRRFEMLKGICESIVNKMMAQQEEIHKKLMEDMRRREEEKIAREEAWKKQEMEKVNKELRLMAEEQAIAGDRQASIIHFLKKYAKSFQGSTENGYISHKTKDPNPSINPNPSTLDNINSLDQAPPSSNVIPNHETTSTINPSFSDTTMLQVPSSPSNSSSALHNPSNNSSLSQENVPLESNSISKCKPSSTMTHEKLEDVGRRWPRDEVLALINLRCMSLKNNNSNNIEDNKESGNKVAPPPPLWERISKGMAEMGYNRSAKRCKEKWENINKYFRKTKDNVKKKRSLDSRTCPYFHQLKSLYSTQGKLVPHMSSENPVADSGHVHRALPESSSQAWSGGFGAHCGGDGGEKINNFDTIVAPLNFDD